MVALRAPPVKVGVRIDSTVSDSLFRIVKYESNVTTMIPRMHVVSAFLVAPMRISIRILRCKMHIRVVL